MSGGVQYAAPVVSGRNQLSCVVEDWGEGPLLGYGTAFLDFALLQYTFPDIKLHLVILFVCVSNAVPHIAFVQDRQFGDMTVLGVSASVQGGS